MGIAQFVEFKFKNDFKAEEIADNLKKSWPKTYSVVNEFAGMLTQARADSTKRFFRTCEKIVSRF